MNNKTIVEKLLEKRKKPAEEDLSLEALAAEASQEPLPEADLEPAPKSRKEIVAELIKQTRGF